MGGGGRGGRCLRVGGGPGASLGYGAGARVGMPGACVGEVRPDPGGVSGAQSRAGAGIGHRSINTCRSCCAWFAITHIIKHCLRAHCAASPGLRCNSAEVYTHAYTLSLKCPLSANTHPQGELRYLDSREDEQARGITMKASAIALLYVPGAATRPEVGIPTRQKSCMETTVQQRCCAFPGQQRARALHDRAQLTEEAYTAISIRQPFCCRAQRVSQTPRSYPAATWSTSSTRRDTWTSAQR